MTGRGLVCNGMRLAHFLSLDKIRLDILLTRCRRQPLGYDCLANRRKCNAGKFEVLNTKRNANYGDAVQQSRCHMRQSQPEPGSDKPDNISNQSKAAGSDVAGF